MRIYRVEIFGKKLTEIVRRSNYFYARVACKLKALSKLVPIASCLFLLFLISDDEVFVAYKKKSKKTRSAGDISLGIALVEIDVLPLKKYRSVVFTEHQ